VYFKKEINDMFHKLSKHNLVGTMLTKIVKSPSKLFLCFNIIFWGGCFNFII